MLCTTREDAKREKEYLQMFSTNKVDGIIICSNLSESSIDYLKEINIPGVTLERVVSSIIPSVAPDNIMGGTIAAQELVERNCKFIRYFKTISSCSKPDS